MERNQRIQQILEEMGAKPDADHLQRVRGVTRNYRRYYRSPERGWIESIADSGYRPPPEGIREAKANDYQIKFGFSANGKRLGRPRKYLRKDGFD